MKKLVVGICMLFFVSFCVCWFDIICKNTGPNPDYQSWNWLVNLIQNMSRQGSLKKKFKIIQVTGLQKQILRVIIKLKKIIKGDANYGKSKVKI